MSIHYDYVIDTLQTLIPDAAEKNAVFLDFGCGAGHIVEKGIESGLNFYGADPYPRKRSDHYKEAADSKNILNGRILQIENDTLPFPDNHFDAVSTNMVFEHIPDISKPMEEIKRVLKPGGLFLALFPTADTLWEGHVNLYFAHWFKPKSKSMHSYLKLMKKLGLGKKADGMTPDEWATHYQKYLHEYCFYRSMKEIDSIWLKNYNQTPKSLACEHMTYRFSKHKRLSFLAPLGKNLIGQFLFKTICHMRGARVLLVQKPEQSLPPQAQEA